LSQNLLSNFGSTYLFHFTMMPSYSPSIYFICHHFFLLCPTVVQTPNHSLTQTE